MLRGRELTKLRKNLLEWFRQYRRELPWRGTRDAYRVWLSEIMLQQTRVAAAIPYYERFLERFPDVRALATAPQEEVLRLWSGLGYYSRARNLQQAAQEMVARFGGEFPHDRVKAMELPGIGAYTAAAILSIAYGEKLAVLDGNAARVLARVFAVRGDLREGKRWQELQGLADALLDSRSPGDWNQAMMELGAMVCTPRSPQCLLCPVTEFCEARKKGLAEVLPETRKKRATVEITLASAVLVDAKGRTLLLPPPKTRESSEADVGTLVSQMWHFPTVAARGAPKLDLREYLGNLSPKLRNGLELVAAREARHCVTYRNLRLQPYRIDVTRLPKIAGAITARLEEVAADAKLAVSNLTRKVARAVLAKAAGITGTA